MDVRAYLHRDGSVIMNISVEDLQNPQATYQAVSGYACLASICGDVLLQGFDGRILRCLCPPCAVHTFFTTLTALVVVCRLGAWLLVCMCVRMFWARLASRSRVACTEGPEGASFAVVVRSPTCSSSLRYAVC